MLACDFFHAGYAVTVRRICVVFVTGAGGRHVHVRVLAVTAHPGGAWTTRQSGTR